MAKKSKKRKTIKAGRNWRIGIFSPVSTPEKAVIMIRQGALVFYIVAVILAALGALTDWTLIAGAAVYAGLGFCLQRWRSRIAALLLVVLSVFYLFLNEAIRRGMVVSRGATNIFFAFVILIIAARVLEATLKLHSKWKEEAPIG